MAPRIRTGRWSLVCLLALVGLAAGCGRHRVWRSPITAPVLEISPQDLVLGAPAAAEHCYAEAVRLEEAGRAECVDQYFQAAAFAWPMVQDLSNVDRPASSRAWTLYHSALSRLVSAAMRFGRWDPRCGLLVDSPAGLAPVPASYHGFGWSPCDFRVLAPVGDYWSPDLSRKYRSPGLGVPLVVVGRSHQTLPFIQPDQPFAATVVLRPAPQSCAIDGVGMSTTPSNAFELAFYNPLDTEAMKQEAPHLPIARDLTAPLAFPTQRQDDRWLRDFLRPTAAGGGDGLLMIEPYQPGKIPVVFVHGLLSDPQTWKEMVNELRARPDIVDRFQFWAFHYDTGEPFFASAAVLRRQLREIRAVYDPLREDRAFSRMILVGHSLGGLVAKLQVVESGEVLWRSAANRPLSQIRTSEETRARLAEAFFFEPIPDVSRVVYIGTPHQGSNLASRYVGRLGSALVRPSAEAECRHAQLIDDNPGVFSGEIVRRIPTSIDMLEPDSPLLRSTLRLHYRHGVALHSVCGVIDVPSLDGPTDGVVPLSSATLRGVCSETIVHSRHTELPRNEATVQEVLRILRLHLLSPA